MNKIKAVGLVFILLLAVSLATTFAVQSAPTAGTESITVTKYALDGTTVLSQQTLTYLQMEATLPVQGDGETLYYMQGPTFLPDNMWDPAETVNLKNKGAVKGTAIKDLIELVGGAEDGDRIQIKAVDGYNEYFQYANIYNPQPGQGKMIVAWYTKNAGDGAPMYPEGAYVPQFADGMQLNFMAETTNADGKHVFGHDDMRTYLPEDNWHYFYSGAIQYPSANGLSLKWITQINIFTQPPPPWSIDVTGTVTNTIAQTEFENCLACHGAVEWTDSSSNVWSGLPLWYLTGFSDDGYIHGFGAYNRALAQAGYDIQIMAGDGYNKIFSSVDAARSSGYIVANKMNGAPLAESSHPLRLVGSATTSGSQRVAKIASINLLNIPTINTWTLELSGASNYTMRQAEFDSAVLCPDHDHSVSYTDGNGDTWEGLPLWYLVSWVDDAIDHGSGAFNDELAAFGYQVKVSAGDGFSTTFEIADVAHNDNIVVAYTLNGAPLPEDRYPLQLNGSALVSNKQRIRQIATIELVNLPTIRRTYLPVVKYPP